MSTKVKVWDLSIRIFHWSLVFLFLFAYVSEDLETLHVYAGYAIIFLLCYRFVWGVIGSRYARFTSFVFGLDEILRYIKSIVEQHPKHYLGHNPLGGISVFILLFCLIAVSWSGLKLYAAEGKGPLARSESISIIQPAFANGKEHKSRNQSEEYWEEIHEALANLTLLFVFIHICGVLFSSYLHEENLIGSMIGGYKQKKNTED